MLHIKYVLTRIQNSIVFSVLEQDNRFSQHMSYKASNGWIVTSNKEPDIDVDYKVIFLRGSDKEKNQKVVLCDSNRKEAQGYKHRLGSIISEIHEALKEWSESCEAFNTVYESEFETFVV